MKANIRAWVGGRRKQADIGKVQSEKMPELRAPHEAFNLFASDVESHVALIIIIMLHICR